MNYEMIDCIDAGTEYCPCHLAESNECILCSQLQGKSFCDCKNWKGTCIYQELRWNNNMATKERSNYEGIILEKNIIEGYLIKFVIKTNHQLCKQLVNPGSYVFMRCMTTSPYFDVPISIMESNVEKDTLVVFIEIEGIKTKKIDELDVGDSLLLKGPFWNGVLGLKNIKRCKEKKVLLIARGIGQSPIVPVLRKMHQQKNAIKFALDKGKYEEIFVQDYLEKYPSQIVQIQTMNKGKLTDDIITAIHESIEEGVEHIHCSGPDILIQEVIKEINGKVTTSSCNNAKMCCGQGVCGACTTRFEGHLVKRLCKLQTDPEYIFEGRRLI